MSAAPDVPPPPASRGQPTTEESGAEPRAVAARRFSIARTFDIAGDAAPSIEGPRLLPSPLLPTSAPAAGLQPGLQSDATAHVRPPAAFAPGSAQSKAAPVAKPDGNWGWGERSGPTGSAGGCAQGRSSAGATRGDAPTGGAESGILGCGHTGGGVATWCCERGGGLCACCGGAGAGGRICCGGGSGGGRGICCCGGSGRICEGGTGGICIGSGGGRTCCCGTHGRGGGYIGCWVGGNLCCCCGGKGHCCLGRLNPPVPLGRRGGAASAAASATASAAVRMTKPAGPVRG